MFKNAIKYAQRCKINTKVFKWSANNIKRQKPKYDFCCMILGQKQCDNCILVLDKKKTK